MARTTKQSDEEGHAPAKVRDPSQIADQLQGAYIKPDDLAKEPPFTILRGYTRMGTDPKGKEREECVFEIVTRDGETFLYTPAANAVRLKWVEVLKAGPVGPCTLRQGEAKQGMNAPWNFCNAKGKPLF